MICLLWAALGIMVGMHLNRLQHNVLATPTKAEQLAGVLRRLSDRHDSCRQRNAEGQLLVPMETGDGQLLDDAAIFCGRFGHLEEGRRTGGVAAPEALCTCDPIDAGPRAVFRHAIYSPGCPKHKHRLASGASEMLWKSAGHFNAWKKRHRV